VRQNRYKKSNNIQHYSAQFWENAYVDQPFIVVLTPGRFNSAYYEHAFLAREMDVPLVSSRDFLLKMITSMSKLFVVVNELM
jgi:uncharacterized circularly permuted ATP-grasp superfamily protein